ncbi:hypothetical protein CRYUN_Cryun26dG0113000 [Craigia yunnanensis]
MAQMKAEEMEFFEEGRQAMRVNYYPPCHLPEKVIGLTLHSDTSAVTILLQVIEVGLQIRKDEKWVPVKSLPNAFIANIGDILQIITNGTYHSIEHRATVTTKRERLSFATFCGRGSDGEIGLAPSLIYQQTPAMFKKVQVEQY